MKSLKSAVSTCILLLLMCQAYSFPTDTASFSRHVQSSAPEEKIKGLSEWAYYHKYISGNQVLADSLANQAVLQAHLREDNLSICLAAITYSKLFSNGHASKAEAYIKEALTFTDRMDKRPVHFQLCLQMAALQTLQGKTDEARTALQQASELIDSKDQKCQYYLVLGDLQLILNEKVNCFSSYNTAVLLSRDCENDSLLIQSYLNLNEFYSLNDNYQKTKEYLKLASDAYTAAEKKDIYDSLLIKANFVEVYTSENNAELAISLADDLMAFCHTHGYLAIRDRVFGSLRKYYLSSNNYTELCNLYCTKYPNELSRLKTTDLTVYYRVQALIYENMQKIDSAIFSFRKAEELITQHGSAASISNFYKRLGQFYLRQHRISDALVHFNQAYEFALQSGHFPFIIENASTLDSLYASRGDLRKAYAFAKIKLAYTDSNTTLLQNDRLMEIEIESLTKMKQLEQEKEELQLNRKSNFQVMIIVFAILLSLIILVLLSNYKIPSSVIKGFGYITFVMFFEFIILILDTKIHHWAHGMPLKIIAVKVILIAILLPVHHATEHKVVHYLLKNRLVSQGGTSLRTALWHTKEWLQSLLKKEEHELPEATEHAAPKPETDDHLV